MKSHSPIGLGITFSLVCGIVLAMGTVVFRAQADVWDKKTVLTVSQPIQVQDTYLEPGTYVFKLADSSSNRHIVHIFNRDQDHLIDTILAIPNYRLQPTGDSRFAFYETPPGTARAMRAWFYPGDNFGQEFRYPREPRLIAALMPAPARLLEAPPEPPPPPIVTQPAEPTPAPEAAEEPPKREEPAVIAQNNPPPPTPEAAPEPPPQAEPKELPKTATPYPLIGLVGLLSLAAYGLLRISSMT